MIAAGSMSAWRRIAFVILLATFTSPFTAYAFCPTTGFKCGSAFGIGKTHQDITVEAVREMYGELFPGVTRSATMDKALEQIYKANALVDGVHAESRRHFDSENFGGSQNYIATNLESVRTTLARGDGNGARAAFGSALHPVQDFYSHTNWIELGNSSPHPSVGRPAPIAHVSTNTPTCSPTETCDDNNLITNGLTSGYWYESATPPAGVRKCYHGGLLDDAVTDRHDGINKDTTNCAISPHSALHNNAASVAKAATKQLIRDLRDQLEPEELRLLFGVGPTLAIAIDTTGSMSPIIAGVKAQAISIVDSRIGTADEPSKYVLVGFNDPTVGPITVTTDPVVFKNAINSLSAFDGGDCPELAFTGMEQAIANSDDGASLFVFTDAGAKDATKALNVIALALKKNVHISIGLFGTCGSESVPGNETGQSSQRFSNAEAALESVASYYLNTAEQTGGQVFALTPSEAGSLTQLANTTLRASAVRILMIADGFDGSPHAYTIPIDDALDSFSVSVSGATESGVVLKRPDMSIVTPGDPGVSVVSLTSGHVVTVDDPGPGLWTLTVAGPVGGHFSVNVDGVGDVGVTSAIFVEEGGSEPHTGLFPIAGLPTIGVPNQMAVNLTEGFSGVAFSLRDLTGAPLATPALQADPNGAPTEYFGTVTPPSGSFLLYVTGNDSHGHAIQRVVPIVVTPQSVYVTAPDSSQLVPGTTTHYVFQVTNVGSAATFNFTATDDRGFVASVQPASAPIGANETIEVAVDLVVPLSAEPGTTDTMTFTAASATASNYGVVTSAVAPESLPMITGIQPASGPTSGGSFVTITGTNFDVGVTVLIGGAPALNVVRISDTTITFTAPPHAAGAVDVVVTNPDTQSATASGAFTYADVPVVPMTSPFGVVILIMAMAAAAAVVLRHG